ncbi:hypothetical protein B0J14DRAFT_538947 [Halenospora varia]|nr:hypothetical protein B0J14DRAFT_538947 [Halenospora varia]
MEDFNIPSPERVALLERLQEAIGGAPPYFWAACQVCDLEALEKLIELARISSAAVRIIAGQCRNMSRYWSAHPGELSLPSTPKNPTPVPSSSDSSSSPAISAPPAKKQKTSDSPAGKVTSSPLLSRSITAKALAKQRDNFRCVLTGEACTEVAHIYPFHSIKYTEGDIFGARHAFWDLLKNFWPEEKVSAWQMELFPGGINEIGLERVSNLITLSPSARAIWDRGAFALKPISMSNDNTTLKVQFFWQKKQQGIEATTSLLTTPFCTIDLEQNEGAYDHGKSMFFNLDTRELIKSGEIFELQTDDPDTLPLPSFKLLEMQWFLQRIAGMAGAAGLDEFDWDEDSDNEGEIYMKWGTNSDEDIPNLGLEEGDISLSIDRSLPASPQFLRKDNLPITEAPKHHTEEADAIFRHRSQNESS